MQDQLLISRFKEMLEKQVVVRATIYPERDDFFVTFSAMTSYAGRLVKINFDYQLSSPSLFPSVKMEYSALDAGVEPSIAKEIAGWCQSYRVLDTVYVAVSSLGSLRKTSNSDWRFLLALSAACNHAELALASREGMPTMDGFRPEILLRNLVNRLVGLLVSQGIAHERAIATLGGFS